MERLQRDAELQPRQVRAEAPVEAAREGDVAVVGSFEVDPGRFREHVGIHVGCGPHDAQLVPGLHLDAVDLEVGRGVPAAGRHRRLHAHELFDRRREERRVRDQPVAFVRVPGEPVDHARQRGRHRVEAGEHEQERDVDDVVPRETVPVHLGGEELVDQVVVGLRRRGAPLEFGLEVLDQLRARRRSVLVVDRSDDAVFHPEQERHVVERQAQLAEEDLARERLAEGRVELDLAVGGEGVDQRLGEVSYDRLEPRDVLRREQRVEQLAVLRVLLAVEHQGNQRPTRTQRDRREHRRIGIDGVDVAAAGDREHVVVACQLQCVVAPDGSASRRTAAICS